MPFLLVSNRTSISNRFRDIRPQYPCASDILLFCPMQCIALNIQQFYNEKHQNQMTDMQSVGRNSVSGIWCSCRYSCRDQLLACVKMLKLKTIWSSSAVMDRLVDVCCKSMLLLVWQWKIKKNLILLSVKCWSKRCSRYLAQTLLLLST